jgi:hypothetical protein
VSKNTSGTFEVCGARTYWNTWPETFTVTVSDAGGSSAAKSDSLTVGDAALTMAALPTLSATAAKTLSGVVAHFSDANAYGRTWHFAATIDWGDGGTSLGMLSEASGGGFDVVGTHIYNQATTATLGVTVFDRGGSSAAGERAVSVVDGPLLTEPPRTIGSGGHHLAMRLAQHGITLRAVAFGGGEWSEDLSRLNSPIDVAFRPVINDFRGRQNVELHLVDWRPEGMVWRAVSRTLVSGKGPKNLLSRNPLSHSESPSGNGFPDLVPTGWV